MGEEIQALAAKHREATRRRETQFRVTVLSSLAVMFAGLVTLAVSFLVAHVEHSRDIAQINQTISGVCAPAEHRSSCPVRIEFVTPRGTFECSDPDGDRAYRCTHKQ